MMPPEWYPQTCVWVCPPHNRDTWPGCLDQAQQQFANFTDKLSRTTPVRNVNELDIITDDSWIRDYGPIFVVDSNQLTAHDFRFNNWGQKYGECSNDNAVTKKMTAHLNIPCTSHDFILEGGSIDINGQGVLLTTEQCLLHPKRNASLNKHQIETKLKQTLGINTVIWLAGGIEGDDTDGHIDDVARFIDDNLVAAVAAPPQHPDHEVTQRNLAALKPFEVVTLPTPDPIGFNDPTEGRRMLPASYANFLMSNGQLLLPVFNQHSDGIALRLLDDALPNWRIEPIPADILVIGYGALHCLTMQQPAIV